MQEEMAAHLAQATDRFRARGMNTGEEMLAARREFGVVSVIQESAREARGGQWIASAIGDLRHAVRHFARAPLMAATIVLTLTLGIGISAAAYGIGSGIFTRPAPGVPDDKSLVTIRGIQVKGGQPAGRSFSYPELIEYAQRAEFTDVAGWWESVVVAGIGGADVGTAYVRYVTPNFFRTLGLRVGPGHGFGQGRVDDHAEPELTAVIGHQFAVVQFGIADSAVGKTIKLNGVNVEIVGVAPREFSFPNEARLWLPIQNDDKTCDRGCVYLNGIGRLRQGATLRAAQQELRTIAKSAEQQYPNSNTGVTYLTITMFRAMAGKYDNGDYNEIEIAGLFWHFVDLVWILVFTFVYLLNPA
jgi:hypothetical protein